MTVLEQRFKEVLPIRLKEIAEADERIAEELRILNESIKKLTEILTNINK